MNDLSPLMKQYFNLAKDNPECILLFQVGEFYELFDTQAKTVSEKIGLTLTEKNSFAMCGIPISKLNIYLKKLVQECKFKIAICDQIESVTGAIMERKVTRIVTPGTYCDELKSDNNFILAIEVQKNEIKLIYADISTGECFVEVTNKQNLIATIKKIRPTEILVSNGTIVEHLYQFDDILSVINKNETAEQLLESYFKNCKYDFNIKNVKEINNSIYMKISSNTLVNLEINEGPNSLFNLLNKTRTAMGKRLLAQYITRPLKDESTILMRQEGIDYFIRRFNERGLLKLDIADLNKLLNNMRDLRAIYTLGLNIEKALNVVKSLEIPPSILSIKIELLPVITIHNTILKQLSINQNNDIVICNENLKTLIQRRNDLINCIHSTVQDYGMNCKVKNISNQYFIELNKNNQLVPSFFILSRSLLSSNRYTTEEIIRLEQQIIVVDETIEEQSTLILNRLRESIASEIRNIDHLIDIIAHMDFFQSGAIAAIDYNYTKPVINRDRYSLYIKNGKHPILSQKNILFVPNDTNLTQNTCPIYLITGPNTGGKSTYIRQTALILYICQLGLFVPAEYMETCIFESMSIRIGTGDNINENKSTFMLEMEETAEIIQITKGKSLVLIDELGRGTSAIEGSAILTAIIKYMEENNFLCIFATHYHSIIEHINPIYLKKMEIISNDNEMKFTYRLVNGFFTESFAIWIIKILNFPKRILNLYEQFLHKT